MLLGFIIRKGHKSVIKQLHPSCLDTWVVLILSMTSTFRTSFFMTLYRTSAMHSYAQRDTDVAILSVSLSACPSGPSHAATVFKLLNRSLHK